MSELLGKETIDTNTYGKSSGRSGNYSTNYQISGRELKKTFGLWIYKEEKKENIRCLCPKCLKDYIHNPDYIVRRLDPFAKVKDHCDKCNQSGWDYVIAERQHNAREKGVSECLRKDMKL